MIQIRSTLMLWIVIIIGVIHIAGFLYAFLRQSDRFTDVIYAFSFALVAGYGLAMGGTPGAFHWILAAMVILWAVRLGIYLGIRIRLWGKDRRFDDFRKEWMRLARFWALQFISIIVIALPVIFAMQEPDAGTAFWQGFGLVIFLAGFLVETVADYQKFAFNRQEKNKGDFIRSGLWKYSRHPNYLGEWLVWTGIFLYCMTTFAGWQWIAVCSPAWIFILLRYISGGNLLEASAKAKYGNRKEYQAYVERTGVFFPKIRL